METRYTDITGIVIRCQKAYNVTTKRNETLWGHYDTNDYCHGRHVGPWYRSKAELLADHRDYLTRAGWITEHEVI